MSKFKQKNISFIVGVDEAGRGPLAGPVTSAAVLAPIDFKVSGNLSTNLRDSKKYIPHQREEWFAYIENNSDLQYEASAVFPKRIDKINVYQAASLASTRAVKRLLERCGVSSDRCKIMLDGSLEIKSKNLDYVSVPGGDEIIREIQMASIVAKVKRDRTMRRYAREFPEYNFDSHKGYGTYKHKQLLKKHGPCRIHRLSFNGVS